MPKGNPNWGKPEAPRAISSILTEFERTVTTLKLKPDEYINSVHLREWVQRNRNARYVPEYLLRAWQIEVHCTM
jgi:hypothetical protein